MRAVSDTLGIIIREARLDEAIRDRLALAQTQIEVLEKRVVELEQENGVLARRLTELGGQTASNSPGEKFVQCRGALFKPTPGGGYETGVYCPRCQEPMSSAGAGAFDYYCTRCNLSVNFRGLDLPNVMRELVKA
jgi:hypothetical protein